MSFRKFKLLSALLAVSFSFYSAAEAAALKVATEATFPPFEFLDDSGKPIGYDMDIIKAIAEEQGIEIEIINMPFDGIIPALMTSQVDASLAGMTITEERAKKVDFSDPYYKSGISALVRKDTADKFKKISDLKDSVLCAQIGTTGAMKAKEISGKVTSFNTNPEAMMELKAKGCDAVVNDRPVNLYFMSKGQDKSVVEIPEILSSEQYGIAVRKGNTELLNLLNEGLKKIRDNGKFTEIHRKWFAVDE
ncbi:MAG: basic amino acid ABC transporter substrate-binding protein [Succinivibrio sp.]|nr:basic amino acid ABC transporter substrate-binding protein [Succinivibrio sp.]